jgi:hypothetical protein
VGPSEVFDKPEQAESKPKGIQLVIGQIRLETEERVLG